MRKAIAFGVGILIGAMAETGVVLLARFTASGGASAVLAIPFVALLLLAGALIGREAARHGAYKAGYRRGYDEGERLVEEGLKWRKL